MDSSRKIDAPQNCLWTLTIVNCVDQSYYQAIYDVTMYLSLIVFLCAVGLLLWRQNNKADARLFSIKGFLAIEGFLFTQIFWGILRVVDCVVLTYDYLPTNMILREMLFAISWLLGSISVTTYLAGILRTIPRIRFYRQKSDPNYKQKLNLPSLQSLAITYFCYISIIGIIVTTCSFFIGYFEMYPDSHPNSAMIAFIMKLTEYGVFAICCFLISFGFIMYGNKLISIAGEGLDLLESVNDYQSHIKSKSSHNTGYSLLGLELEMKHKRLKRSVYKMHIINISFISSILILGIILATSAIFFQQTYENLIINKIFAAFTNLFPMLVNVAVMAGIVYGEMKVPNKYEDFGISSTPTNSQPPPRESIDAHMRNPSADSESPLLSFPSPAPKVYKLSKVRTVLIRACEQIIKGVKEGPANNNKEKLKSTSDSMFRSRSSNSSHNNNDVESSSFELMTIDSSELSNFKEETALLLK
ncbi:10371_t:CDS:2 [Entrophospora sp. SA101]|nr:10371_t:CDS:2 [Entrophospora sp. SA101]